MAKLHVTSAEKRATLQGNAGPVDQAEEAAVKVAGQQCAVISATKPVTLPGTARWREIVVTTVTR